MTGLVARITGIAELASRRAEWQALCDSAIEPNPFYGPDYLIASEEALHPKHPIRILIVEREGRLQALFPLEKPVLRDLLFGRAWRMYRNHYTCLGTPLIARDGASEILAAALDHLSATRGPKRLLLQQFPTSGALADLVAGTRQARSGAFTQVSSHQRAAVTTPLSAQDYALSHWSGNRRKALAKKRKALAANGALAARSFCAGDPEFGRMLDAFLALEASGWKGKTGTALASDAASEAFTRTAFSGPDARIETLVCGDRIVAMVLMLQSQRVGYTVKVAYAEDVAKDSPGVVLDAELVRLAAREGDLASLDSCALPGHPVEALWAQRLGMADMVLGLTPQRADLGTAALSHWIRLVARLKAMRHSTSYSSKPATP
jgi:CelD/BcsL family acetyltransferase involved in cellulose biosynthesis